MDPEIVESTLSIGEFGKLIAFMGGISILAWALAEGIGKVLTVKKIWTALGVSMGSAIILTGAGYMPNPTGAEVPWNYMAAALAGLLAAGGAKMVNDKINPLKKAR